jgi:hypothetical protein
VTDPDGEDAQPDAADGAIGGARPGGAHRSDRLDRLREEVDAVDRLPVGDRVGVFERVNDGIAAELARLDEA